MSKITKYYEDISPQEAISNYIKHNIITVCNADSQTANIKSACSECNYKPIVGYSTACVRCINRVTDFSNKF